jgi:hypothetical protein
MLIPLSRAVIYAFEPHVTATRMLIFNGPRRSAVAATRARGLRSHPHHPDGKPRYHRARRRPVLPVPGDADELRHRPERAGPVLRMLTCAIQPVRRPPVRREAAAPNGTHPYSVLAARQTAAADSVRCGFESRSKAAANCSHPERAAPRAHRRALQRSGPSRDRTPGSAVWFAFPSIGRRSDEHARRLLGLILPDRDRARGGSITRRAWSCGPSRWPWRALLFAFDVDREWDVFIDAGSMTSPASGMSGTCSG